MTSCACSRDGIRADLPPNSFRVWFYFIHVSICLTVCAHLTLVSIDRFSRNLVVERVSGIARGRVTALLSILKVF